MKKGFTLIELMIVVVIIGILAAIAIPKFTSIQEDAKRSACRSNMKNISTAEHMYYTRLGHGYATALELESSDILGNATGMTCPADGSAYVYTIDNTAGAETYTIECANSSFVASHGSITDGVSSWAGETT